jgi:hypothetical protein
MYQNENGGTKLWMALPILFPTLKQKQWGNNTTVTSAGNPHPLGTRIAIQDPVSSIHLTQPSGFVHAPPRTSQSDSQPSLHILLDIHKAIIASRMTPANRSLIPNVFSSSHHILHPGQVPGTTQWESGQVPHTAGNILINSPIGHQYHAT